MDKDKLQDRIDGHLLGRNSREERLEFEEEITRNPELSQGLADTERALAAIEMAEDAKLKARLQALEAKLAAAPPEIMEMPPEAVVTPLASRQARTQARVRNMKQNRKGTFNLLGYAAALLLVVAVGWWALNMNTDFSPEQLAMESFEPYDNIATGTVRGEEDTSAEAAAFNDYDAEDYAAAATKFRALPATDVTSFYLAQSLLAQQDFAAAAPIFTTLSTQADFALAPESAYYAALSRLGKGELVAAKEALTLIAATPGHPQAAAAKGVLEKL
jgi:hypothetical protein